MKTATQAYKSQMAKLLRNHSYVGVAFGNIDVTAGSDGTWQGSKVSWSDPKTMNFDHNYAVTAATLEPNRWHLDGGQVIRASGGNYGWVGSTMSSTSGSLTYVMTRNFDVSHALSGITITFDSNVNEYPKNVTLEFTNEDSTTVTTTVHPTSSTVEIELASDSVRQAKLTLSSMIPRRRVRVLTTLWGIGYSYTNNEIISCSQSTDVDPLSRRLPQEKFSFTIHDYKHTFDPDNPMGIYATINKGAPIKVAYGYELDNGTVEWLKEDIYSLDNKPSFANSKVTFSGTGLLSTLTRTYYKGVLGNKSFYDMAVDVLEDANLTPAASGEDPWDIDDSLKTMYTTAPLPIASHAECLQMIAHACDCRLHTDDDNIIHITPFGVTPLGIFSGELSDTGHEWISSLDNVDYGTPSDSTYVTLENNRWALGTNQVIADESYIISKGYVSEHTSNALYIVKQPYDVAAPSGKQARTTFTAVGDGLTYQWYLRANPTANWSKSSIKTNTYTVNMTSSNNGIQLYCEVKDAYGNKINTEIVTFTLSPDSDTHYGDPAQTTDMVIYNLPETVTKRFDILHDVPMVSVMFDNVTGEYPESFVVSFYDEDDNLIYTHQETVTSETHTISTEVEDCAYFIISDIKMRVPQRRARITRFAYFETDYSLTLDLVKQDTLSTTRLDRLKDVYVSQYSYTPSQDSQRSKLYEATTDETVIHAEYQMATDITITVTGGIVVSSEVYAQAADITLSAGTKTVLIEGIPVNEGSVVYSYNFNSSGEDDVEENRLITNKAMADAHAQHIGEYLNMRNTYDAAYRGNPEVETGDIISVQTAYGNVVYGLVLVDGIDFNGALSGKLKIKGLV